MKISIEKLKEAGACKHGIDYFAKVIGEGQFTVKEAIAKIKASGIYPSAEDVSSLMYLVPEMRTKEVYQLFVDCKPDAYDVRSLMCNVPEMRTKEVYQLFVDCKPSAYDVRRLMEDVPEMKKYEEEK